jgi:phosphatidylglycerophosphate synthase
MAFGSLCGGKREYGGAVTTLVRRGVSLTIREPTVGAGAQLVLLAMLWAGVGLGPAGWLAGIAHAVVTWALLSAALHRSALPSLGAANRVTLTRSVLSGGVTALVADHLGAGLPTAARATLVAITTVALVLDGVDGQIARRTGTETPLGARFDMEVDAFLILVLSVVVAESLGWWVLAIGLMRYAFVAAAWAAPWLNAPLPPSRARKTVAALQGIVLAAASAEVIWRPLVFAAVALALASLLWSFTRDVLWLARHRVRDRAPSRRRESRPPASV